MNQFYDLESLPVDVSVPIVHVLINFIYIGSHYEFLFYISYLVHYFLFLPLITAIGFCNDRNL